MFMAIDTEPTQCLPKPPAGAAPPAVFHHNPSTLDHSEQPQPRTPSPAISAYPARPLPGLPQSSSSISYEDSAPYFLKDSHPKTSSSSIAFGSALGELTSPPPHITTSVEVLVLMVKHTSAWVLGGIGMMVVGIGIAQSVFLPRIRTCPADAECPGSYDLNSTNALTLLQTLMQYWLKAGMVLATMGLLKLSTYQAWFIMMRDGNTMDNLDLNLGAIRGSLLDAARLIFRRGNRWLSVFILSQLGVGAAISLIIGLSITRDKGTQPLRFTYSGVTQFPDTSYRNTNTAGQIQAIAKVNAWALTNDTTHSSAHRGSLVIPDGRNIAINSRPGGPRIKGTLSCTGVNDYNITESLDYDMFANNLTYTATRDMGLAVSMTKVATASMTYIWASNTTGRLPNATQTSDGVMFMALCTHKIYFENATQVGDGNQEISPSTPIASGCGDADENLCAADSVSNAIFSWWGGRGTSMWDVNCRGSVVGPLPPSGVPDEDNCVLTEGLWTETATSMLDGLVQTAPRSLNPSQTLIVPVETLNTRRWWLQALIPFLTLVLYGVGLFYTLLLSRGNNTLKKLTLAEVIGAAHTEHVRSLLDSGNLEKTTMQYGGETGFIIPNHRIGSRPTVDDKV